MKLNRAWLWSIGIVLLCGLSFFSGAWVLWSKLSSVEEEEEAFYLRFSIDQLALIQQGDIEQLRRIREIRAQQFIATALHGKEWGEISPDIQEDLVVAKRYLQRFPVLQPSENLDAALKRIPDRPIDPESCSPAVKRLLDAGEL